MSKDADLMREFLQAKGFDLDDCNLCNTPERIDRMYKELFHGEGKEPEISFTTFEDTKYNDLVIIRDIPVYSICSHHFVPFTGVCHIAYIPENKILGLSKFPRIVEHFCCRAQIQEKLVAQIADFIFDKLKPAGILVTIQAEHLCVSMRGVKKPGVKMITTAIRGEIDKHEVFETLRTL